MEAAIGIIGLSIQIIDTSVKIKRKIDSYRSASKDISRLAAKIDQAEAICEALKAKINNGAMDSQATNLVQRLGPPVLQSIKSTLGELEAIISMLEAKAARKGSIKSLGLSFLKKQDVIEKLSEELDKDLINLQCLMVTDVL